MKVEVGIKKGEVPEKSVKEEVLKRYKDRDNSIVVGCQIEIGDSILKVVGISVPSGKEGGQPIFVLEKECGATVPCLFDPGWVVVKRYENLTVDDIEIAYEKE